jgi:hypothetical protein
MLPPEVCQRYRPPSPSRSGGSQCDDGDQVARLPALAAVGGIRSQFKYISTSSTCFNYLIYI